MIAISTYTELVPVNTAVNELSQTHETEEGESSSGFAEILAGLLKSTETVKTDIPPVEFSDAESRINVFTGEEIIAGERPDLFGTAETVVKVFENDLHDIPEEHMGFLLNADHLFVRTAETASAFDQKDPDSISMEVSEIVPDTMSDKNDLLLNKPAEKANLSQNTIEAAEKNARNFAEINHSKAVNSKAHETSQQAQDVAENLPDEKNVKKDTLKESLHENVKVSSSRADSREDFISAVKIPENENRRSDETRGRSRRDRISFEVRDLRTANVTETNSYRVVETAAGRPLGEVPVREMTLELRLPDNSPAGQNPNVQAQSTWEAKAGIALESMLARELHNNFNGDIVRHASMVLRDGGEGTIRIALKPETLGNVKIHLEMTENKITGRIFVESKEALNAFRKEISSLEQAFRDSGYADAELNLSLTTEGQSGEKWEQDADSFTPRMAALRYEGSYEQDAHIIDVFIERNQGSINMLA